MKKRIVITYNAPVVLTFVILCFVVVLIGYLTGNESTRAFFVMYHSSLKDPLTYVRFFTHVVGHADWNHFIANAAYLLLLGPVLEERYGAKAMIKVIVLTAVVTGVIHYIFFPNNGLCGASGVAFAFIILVAFTGFKRREIPLTLILVVVIYIGQQVYQGMTLSDDVSNLSHLIGGLVGATLGVLLNRSGKSR